MTPETSLTRIELGAAYILRNITCLDFPLYQIFYCDCSYNAVC